MIIQRLFSRKDYEGLSEEAKEKLKKSRKRIADKLRKERESISTVNPSKGWPFFELEFKDINDVDEYMKMNSGEEYLKSGIRKKTYERELNSARSSARDAREDILKEELKNKEKAAVGKAEKAIKEEAPGFFKKYKKPLLIGGGAVALGGAGLYGYKKLKKNNK